jgi:hypothetical protein
VQRPARHDGISNLQLEQVASAQLAIDAKIEQRQFARSAEDLKPNPDSPDFLKFEWCFLTYKFALVPRARNTLSKLIHATLLKVEKPQPDSAPSEGRPEST